MDGKRREQRKMEVRRWSGSVPGGRKKEGTRKQASSLRATRITSVVRTVRETTNRPSLLLLHLLVRRAKNKDCWNKAGHSRSTARVAHGGHALRDEVVRMLSDGEEEVARDVVHVVVCEAGFRV